uniref:Uncharacterized protein n=1 Tax=Cyclophora tenuis TaxID=216820 RepID=A0A7S1CX87_CYCTE|mmetsp:Transcript_1100/g.2019  ORF Transcript_1100/g.2019 Transcript_1100/m.2019 type:complete len:408 (+) Transcript_1100:118-1341(+)
MLLYMKRPIHPTTSPPRRRRGRERDQNHLRSALWLPLTISVFLVVYLTTDRTSTSLAPADASTVAMMTLSTKQQQQQQQQQQQSYGVVVPRDTSSYPLTIPQGEGVALPSVRSSSSDEVVDRSLGRGQSAKYGGEGDKKHLGGFTDIDTQGISPAAWKWIIERMNVQSILDLGCGRGISTTWFLFHGLDALCVEGSHDARDKTMLPNPQQQMIEHDFARGPYWPAKTYDAVWCVEFLEHVGRNFHHNYLPTLRKAGILFTTHSIWGGWHHVEVHKGHWWKHKLEQYGFLFSPELTQAIRTAAWNETKSPTKGIAPNGDKLDAAHIFSPKMLVFINPAVTALPQHAHLYYEPGCYEKRVNGTLYQRECRTEQNETPLPDSFKPLPLTLEQDKKWFDWVKDHVQQKAQS